MGQDCIGKSIERLLQTADDLIGAQESTAAFWNRGPLDPVDVFTKNIQALKVNWHRLLSRTGSKDAELDCAKTWINAFFEQKLVLRIELLLASVREKAAAATTGDHPASRCAYALYRRSFWVKVCNKIHKSTIVTRGDGRRPCGAVPRAEYFPLLQP